VGIWIDHKRAVIVSVSTGGITTHVAQSARFFNDLRADLTCRLEPVSTLRTHVAS
jgi:hypothetical protein